MAEYIVALLLLALITLTIPWHLVLRWRRNRKREHDELAHEKYWVNHVLASNSDDEVLAVAAPRRALTRDYPGHIPEDLAQARKAYLAAERRRYEAGVRRTFDAGSTAESLSLLLNKMLEGEDLGVLFGLESHEDVQVAYSSRINRLKMKVVDRCSAGAMEDYLRAIAPVQQDRARAARVFAHHGLQLPAE